MTTRAWMMLSVTMTAAMTSGALAGCGSTSDAGPTEAEIRERVAAFDTSGEFTQINATPFDSQHAAASVSVWVSTEGVETYLGIDPEDPTDRVDAFPTGTIIIKEMFDEAGARTALTVMVKGGEGGDPDTADWWWGAFSPAGDLQQGGSIGFCISCHEGNGLARTDWVYGVENANRM